jgi:putative transposase
MELLLNNPVQRSIILKDWQAEVKENFWQQDATPFVRQILKELMEKTMIEELEVVLKTQSTQGFVSYRNGYYQRNLITQFGNIDAIRVPRLRDTSFHTGVFKRYSRYQNIIEDLVQDIFLAGISTRRVGDALCKLLGTKISSSKVSTITKRLDRKVQVFHQRKILDEFQYLILDGISLKIRYNGKYHNRKVLVAYGMTLFGQRILIDFRQARGESQNAWEVLLNDLYKRGLEGKQLRLIVMDGSAGLKAASDLVYPHAKIQRCWAHKLRNVSSYCKKKYETDCLKDAKKIYLSSNRILALRAFSRWKIKWRSTCANAVRCLERDLEDLLPFLDCPKSHQIKIRTTNAIERSFREVRRRTRVFSCFSNTASSERIIFAIFSHLNNHWKAKPLDDFTQFT